MTQPSELPVATSGNDTDEIDLLELLAVVAENLKLLILGPLVVGALALGAAYALPPTYESVSILHATKKITPQFVASLINSADVQEAVAQEMGLYQGATRSQRLRNMLARVSAAAGRQGDLVTLTTRGETAEQAQQLNQAVLAHVYPLTLPAPAETARVQMQLKVLQDGMTSGTALERSVVKQLQLGSYSDGAARLYGELQSSSGKRAGDIANLLAQLEGLSDANLVQQPTLPDLPAKPRKALIAIVAALAAGMLLLLFVFIRQSFRSASDDPERVDAVRRLRVALGLKS